jgi:hypothetical protein
MLAGEAEKRASVWRTRRKILGDEGSEIGAL